MSFIRSRLEEKKPSVVPNASNLGKKCWRMSCFLLTLGCAGIATAGAISAVNCSFTVGVPDQNSTDCARGFYLAGASLLVAVSSWCGFGLSKQIKHGEVIQSIKADRLKKLPKVAANPAAQFSKAVVQPIVELKEIKIDKVIAPS